MVARCSEEVQRTGVVLLSDAQHACPEAQACWQQHAPMQISLRRNSWRSAWSCQQQFSTGFHSARLSSLLF